MADRYILVGNWKMNKTPREAVALVEVLLKKTRDCAHEIVVAPPFVSLYPASKLLENSHIGLAAQDLSAWEEGAYTGEISAAMLRELGVTYVIVGHSERRKYWNETNELINRKIKTALSHQLRPILCIGEDLTEREQGRALEVCSSQLEEGLAGISAADMSRLVLAYEPVWAIGTGKTATPELANEVHSGCREKLTQLYGPEIARNTVIQYGGSVNAQNIKELMLEPEIDGALIGGASISIESFMSLLAALD